jgi:hypothetical protein
MMIAIQEAPEWLRPLPALLFRPIGKVVSSDNNRYGELDSFDETEADTELGSAPGPLNGQSFMSYVFCFQDPNLATENQL